MLRVKRRVTDDPLEAFVLNSKRRREEQLTADKEEVSTILKFAGTVQNQTEGLHQASKLSRDEARTIVNRVRKEPLDQMRQRRRDEQRQNAQNERFRIVNCSRRTLALDGVGGEDLCSRSSSSTSRIDDAAVAAKEITILDIEKDDVEGEEQRRLVEQERQTRTHPNTTGVGSLAATATTAPVRQEDNQADYVYDLYVPDVNQPELEWSEQFLENMLRIQPYDLMYDHYRDPQNKLDYSDGDSEDSNEENHYGNEYPDSDESTGARAMRRAMEVMELEDEDSSDDEDFYEGGATGRRDKEEGYTHTLEVDGPEFVDDVDFQDTADRYGVAYAKYKRRILKAFENAPEIPTDDEGDGDRSSDSDFFGARGDTDDDDEYRSENELDKYA